MGVADNLRVSRRRRCPYIVSSPLLDLASPDPSANIIVFMERDTKWGRVNTQNGKTSKSTSLGKGIFLLQARIFSANMLAERKYVQPSQSLKNFLKKMMSIWTERPSGLEGNGLRDFDVSVSSKIH